jgi:hypothetical protein
LIVQLEIDIIFTPHVNLPIGMIVNCDAKSQTVRLLEALSVPAKSSEGSEGWSWWNLGRHGDPERESSCNAPPWTVPNLHLAETTRGDATAAQKKSPAPLDPFVAVAVVITVFCFTRVSKKSLI